MRRRKKTKNNSLPKHKFSLPFEVKRLFLSLFSFVFVLILIFAFFGKAGEAGKWILVFFGALLGKGVFLLPVFSVLAGLGFVGMKKDKSLLVILALLSVVAGVSGILGTVARSQDIEVRELAGLLGQIISLPIFSAFGFWVSEILFFALLVFGGVLWWQTFSYPELIEKIPPIPPAEKVKKILEPKFEVMPVVVEEPKIKTLDKEIVPKDNLLAEKEPAKIKSAFKNKLFFDKYALPPPSLLDSESGLPNAGDIRLTSALIKKTLQNFDIPVEVSEVNIGPTVTQYAIKPAEGIKLSKITALSNDLALALAAHPIRIEAPIPSRALVGIEVPNKVRMQVRLRPFVESEYFKTTPSPLLFVLGRDVAGNPMFADLNRMPHLLIGGATGTGKTIGLNSIILSLLYRNSPQQLRFILVDPKRVEFLVYSELPHLLTPVVYDAERTINVLIWLIKEMERRFQLLSRFRVRDIHSYHTLLQGRQRKEVPEDLEPLPYIVLIIDELADLMAARGKEMEAGIVRLAQMARAVGIHLILATQRPSVEVITGLIKANITSRIAFQVASQVDSRTILDTAGAEKLLGQGDMLFISAEISRPKRIQGVFVSEKEVKRVVEWIADQTKDFAREEIKEEELAQIAKEDFQESSFEGEQDPLYEEAKRVVIEYQKASASLLQRRLKIGYARAARLLDMLESNGVVGPGEGAKPREVYLKKEEPFSDVSKEDEDAGTPDSPWFR